MAPLRGAGPIPQLLRSCHLLPGPVVPVRAVDALSGNQSASVQVLDYTTLRHYRMSMFSKLLKNSVNEFAFISDDSGVDGAVPDVTDWITGSMMFSMRV